MHADHLLALCAPGVPGLKPYEPGKPIAALERELGIRGAIKLASNENPLGPSPKALAAVREALPYLAFYPEGAAPVLKDALAARLAVGPEQLILGNGSNEVLEIIARTFLAPGTEAVISEHAFAVYAIVSQSAGAMLRVAPARDYGHDLEAMAALVGDRTRLIFIANPNNPTGTWHTRQALEAFLDALPNHVIVVLDEAYFEYMAAPDYPDGIGWLSCFENILVTRTFSKLYGLAGLRVGYGVGHPDLIALLERVREPFNVNSLAQIGAAAALDDGEHVERSLRGNREGMVQVGAGLSALGVSCLPPSGNFITFHVGQGGKAAYGALLRKGVIVRPLGPYGMADHLRVSIGTAEENRRFLEALGEVLETL